MSVEIRSAIDFYERHPISSEIILAKLNASRGHLNDVAPEELFPHDQDHYGGLEANDALAAVRSPSYQAIPSSTTASKTVSVSSN